MTTILANGENSCPLRNVTNYMGTLRKVKGVHPLMDKGFQLLWYICMGEVQVYLFHRYSSILAKAIPPSLITIGLFGSALYKGFPSGLIETLTTE